MANIGRPRLPDKISTQIRLYPPLFAKLKVIAAREARSMNAQMEVFLGMCVEDYEREYGTIDVAESTEES